VSTSRLRHRPVRLRGDPEVRPRHLLLERQPRGKVQPLGRDLPRDPVGPGALPDRSRDEVRRDGRRRRVAIRREGTVHPDQLRRGTWSPHATSRRPAGHWRRSMRDRPDRRSHRDRRGLPRRHGRPRQRRDMAERDARGDPVLDAQGHVQIKTAHSLNPVLFLLHDYAGRALEFRDDLPMPAWPTWRQPSSSSSGSTHRRSTSRRCSNGRSPRRGRLDSAGVDDSSTSSSSTWGTLVTEAAAALPPTNSYRRC